ncbi:MAG: dephospho-CoA kinase [Bacteroidetes bacterium]|nr:MAG: dephospho-CoA kinase [Bacteroidota bacterium]
MCDTENVKDFLIVGLTGGIGSGKSTVARVFEALGVPCFDSDKVAHSIYAENKYVRQSIIERFGGGVAVWDKNGESIDIERKKLGKIAFSQKGGIAYLNRLVHPEVKKSFEVWTKALAGNTPYVIREAAILFESGASKDCDLVITVSTCKSQRLERLLKRDNGNTSVSLQIIEAKIKAQISEEERLRMSDYVIFNNDKDEVLPQIEKLHYLHILNRAHAVK